MAAAEFFVDANIIIYSTVPSEQGDACSEILAAITNGQAAGRTSPAVLEEVWHIERSGRAGDLRSLTQHAFTLFSPLLPVTDQAFRLALAVQGSGGLGANDRVHVGTCLAHGIDYILSADSSFDGVSGIRRVDPLDVEMRRRL